METNVLRRINDGTFTWQPVNRSLDNVTLPDLASAKVMKIDAGE
jgi:hypothetical protein